MKYMNNMLINAKTWLAILPLLLSATCYTFKDASFPPDLKTFEVKYIPNQAELVNPTLSQTITEALKDKVLQESNLDLVDEEGHVKFTGAITDYAVTPVAANSGETVTLNRLKVVLKISFENRQDEKKSWETSFSRFIDFDSNLNFSTNEAVLVEEITAQLVDDIFKKAFVNW